jgi:TRAP-type uncharacterized transport system substrate-binding protein
MMRFGQKWIITFELKILLALLWGVSPALAQKTVRLPIATGGTGGSYYPMGGGRLSHPLSPGRHSQL